MESNKNIETNQSPKRFKLISYYKEEWEKTKKTLLELKAKSINEKISTDEKFLDLYTLIQKVESQNRTCNHLFKNIKYLKTKNCIGLKKAIKSYFSNDESIFYSKILPFIIDQALLIEERANNKYGEQTLPIMPSTQALKESIPKKLILSILSNNFFCNDKDYISQLNSEQKKTLLYMNGTLWIGFHYILLIFQFL